MNLHHIFLYISAVLAAVPVISSCNGDEEPASVLLDEVKGYIFDYPDSALNVLSGLDSLMTTREMKGRYALLYSIASDITGQTPMQDSLVNLAYDYYRRYGSAKDRFEAYYLIGRIYANSGNENSAMSCFVRAEQYLGDNVDPGLAGRLYFSKARLYEDGFGYRDAIDNYRKACDYYLKSGETERYTESCMRAAMSCSAIGDRKSAEDFLAKMDECKDGIRDSDKVRYVRLMSRMDDNMSQEEVLEIINNEIDDFGKLDAGNLLAISDVYLQAGQGFRHGIS